jgi:hypothetical protein
MSNNIYTYILPESLRKFIRTVHRKLVFLRAMKRFLKNPEESIRPGNSMIPDLIYGWGNESWSASDEFLISCITQTMNSEGHILECGSGLTTILLGAIAKRRGLKYWALEHKPEWAAKLDKHLKRYKIDSVVLLQNELKDFGDFEWYDVPSETLPDHFNLIICDGPPGTTKGGRYGLFPVMGKRIHQGCIVLLDDAHRKDELSIADRWQNERNTHFDIKGNKRPFIEMKVLTPYKS